jgi:chitin disaccharide deacetylase
MMSRRLIVTADDVGLDRGMTAGAIRAHREGIVTACSIVANGREFDDAVARLRDVPSLEAGVHLALVEERALTTGQTMPRNYVRFVLSRPRNVEPELRAQIEKVLATGLRVTHLNGHQHLHMLPRVRRIVEKLAREYGIGYVRVVNDRGGRARRVSMAVLNILSRAQRGISGTTALRSPVSRGGSDDPALSRGINSKSSTIGVAEAGHLTAERIIELFDHVDGLTELVTHPGENVAGYAHWNYAWDEETRALCDPRVREAIAARGIQLVAPSAAT